MAYKTIAAAHAEETRPLARRVLEYSLTFRQVMELGTARAVTADDWAPLAALVATDRFERIGVAREVMTWNEYVGFVSGYANAARWDGSLRRVTQAGNLVFLELEERGTEADGGKPWTAGTVTVYEFDDADKIVHLDVYIQGMSA
jgi:hypothetical protein